jgi:hypothetical protein
MKKFLLIGTALIALITSPALAEPLSSVRLPPNNDTLILPGAEPGFPPKGFTPPSFTVNPLGATPLVSPDGLPQPATDGMFKGSTTGITLGTRRD